MGFCLVMDVREAKKGVGLGPYHSNLRVVVHIVSQIHLMIRPTIE